jgi:hypothetical protein
MSSANRAAADTRRAQDKLRRALASKISEACAGKKKLTLEQKAEIIRPHCPSNRKKGLSAKVLGEQFGVQPRQIRRICSILKREEIKAACESGVDAEQRKSVLKDKFPEVTRELLEWCSKMRTKFRTVKRFNCTLSGAVVKARALKIAQRLGIKDFKASEGWLYQHNKKYGLKSVSLDGEGNDVDP